ncbi:UNVERIFIED_CONTAM: hypothetical protein GTU68_003060 [Idotea baltica]|nr:hypothetical protein [Idotea baltica]
MTFSIGRDFAPQRIVGIDIDKKLVNIGKKNVKHYLVDARDAEEEFPKSMKLLYGPLKRLSTRPARRSFLTTLNSAELIPQSNYVLENDALLETVRPEFDTVLCLSVTKWVHLNWGDAGLKRFFRRIFRNLKPGGRLILEPQAWPSYNKKRKLTSEIFENYKSIRLFPNKFGEFLTSDVGFQFVKKGSVYQHYSRGFDRPIYIYKKVKTN